MDIPNALGHMHVSYTQIHLLAPLLDTTHNRKRVLNLFCGISISNIYQV